jgi:hypothetical protein
MPTRTVVSPAPKKRVRAKPKTPVWPFPPGVGDAIGPEWRKYHLPQDDYYYMAFSLANTKDETADNFKLLGKMGIPFEYSLSPSGCICYRLHRKYEKTPTIQCPLDSRETVPVYLPGIQYGRLVQWRMSQQNSLAFLFKEWQPVPLERNPRRRAKT